MSLAEAELIVLGEAEGIAPLPLLLFPLGVPIGKPGEGGEVGEGSEPQGVAMELVG